MIKTTRSTQVQVDCDVAQCGMRSVFSGYGRKPNVTEILEDGGWKFLLLSDNNGDPIEFHICGRCFEKLQKKGREKGFNKLKVTSAPPDQWDNILSGGGAC